MLAKISEGIPDAIKQLKGAPFLAEYKYDGTRAQIHLLPDNTVKVFSRNCEDKTASMPDVVAAIQAAAKGMQLHWNMAWNALCHWLVSREAKDVFDPLWHHMHVEMAGNLRLSKPCELQLPASVMGKATR